MSDPFGNWPTWDDVANLGKKAVDFVVQGFLYKLNPVGTIVTTTLHYNRNILNETDYTQEELGDPLPESKSKFHQNNKY